MYLITTANIDSLLILRQIQSCANEETMFTFNTLINSLVRSNSKDKILDALHKYEHATQPGSHELN